MLNLLKAGSIVGQGTYVPLALLDQIDVPQWSRPSGWIDTGGGDLLEEVDNSLVPRWTGVLI